MNWVFLFFCGSFPSFGFPLFEGFHICGEDEKGHSLGYGDVCYGSFEELFGDVGHKMDGFIGAGFTSLFDVFMLVWMQPGVFLVSGWLRGVGGVGHCHLGDWLLLDRIGSGWFLCKRDSPLEILGGEMVTRGKACWFFRDNNFWVIGRTRKFF